MAWTEDTSLGRERKEWTFGVDFHFSSSYYSPCALDPVLLRTIPHQLPPRPCFPNAALS